MWHVHHIKRAVTIRKDVFIMGLARSGKAPVTAWLDALRNRLEFSAQTCFSKPLYEGLLLV